MAKAQDEIAKEVISEYEYLSNQRSTTESHWEEIAERFFPNDARSFNNNGFNNPGEKRNQEIFDSTPVTALNRFTAIMDSLLTPATQMYQRLRPSDPYLEKSKSVRLYFEEVNRVLFRYRYKAKSNFAAQNQAVFKSVGAYGNGSLYMDKMINDTGIRYKYCHLSETYFSENHQGMIDKILRRFPLSARQAFQKWGDLMPDKIQQDAEKSPESVYFFFHCVKPREEAEMKEYRNRVDYKGMPFASYYVSEHGAQFISEGGYSTFPYATSRFEMSLDPIYARSPAMDVLPAVKTLNSEKKTILRQGHMAVDPPLLSFDDGILDMLQLTPGAQIIGGVNKDGRPLVHTVPVGNIAIGKDLMDDEKAAINDAFFVSLFQILVENPKVQTATEVMERVREKGILMAPPFGRQYSEYLSQMTERELDLLTQQRLLPPMPFELIEAKGEYHIEFDSPLTRSQKAEEAAGFMRALETALSVVNVTQDPKYLDHYNFDVIIPEVSSIQGLPERWMQDPRLIAAVRAKREQDAQIQQAIQAGPAIAAVTKSQAALQKAGG